MPAPPRTTHALSRGCLRLILLPCLVAACATPTAGGATNVPAKAIAPPEPVEAQASPAQAAIAEPIAEPIAPRAPLPVEDRQFSEALRCSVDDLSLHALGKEWFGMCGGAHSSDDLGDAHRGSAFSIRADGVIRPEPGMFRGPLPSLFTLRAVHGRSLDDFDIALARPDVRGESFSWFTRAKNGFRPAAPRASELWPRNYGVPGRAWIAGHQLVGPGLRDGFSYVDGHRGWLPRPAPGSTPKCEQRIPNHEALALAADGVLWGLGKLCEGGFGVERFEVGKRDSTIEVLTTVPESEWPDVGLVVTPRGLFAHVNQSPPTLYRRTDAGWETIDTTGLTKIELVLPTSDEVLILGGARVLRVEGAGLVPVAEGIRDLVWAPDGAVWMHDAAGLLRWSERTLTRVRVTTQGNPALKIQRLAFNAAGGALLVAASPDAPGSVLLEESRTRSAASLPPFTLKGEASLASPFQSFHPLRGADCTGYGWDGMGDQRVWVLLYRLSRGAPADYDFPATRAALRGQTAFQGVEFVEIESLGERHFVGITDSGDLARALVQRIRSEVRGSAPQAFCRAMTYPHTLAPVDVTRRLHFDLRTGELSRTAAP